MKHDNLDKLCSYLASSREWVTASELASYLHVTPRTVINYIKKINTNATDGGPICSSEKGYCWKTDRKHSVTPYVLEHLLPEMPSDRIIYIIRKILYNKTTDILSLMSALAISERTLEADIIRAKEIIKFFHLRLHIHHELFSISGKESDRRRLIVYCIFCSGQTDFLTLEYLKKSFSDMDVEKLYALLIQILNQFSLTCDSYHIYFLLLHIILQISQIRKGLFICREELHQLSLSENCQEVKASKAFCDSISEQVLFPEAEKIYLTMLLFVYTFPSDFQIELPFEHDKWLHISASCLQIAEQYLHISCTEDQFPQALSHFFVRLSIRQSMGLGKEHLLSDSIRKVHPLLMDISSNILCFLAERIYLEHPEQETGFLALFLADYLYKRYPFESKVSCNLINPFSKSITNHLAEELEARLGNTLHITHIVSSIDVEYLPQDSDITISLIPLENLPHVVIISPLPKSEDYRRIRHEITAIKRDKDLTLLKAYFTAYLRPEHFEIDHSFDSPETALHYICKKLKESGAVGENFEKALLLRESIDTTAFHDLIALPHACCNDVKRNSLYIISNKKSMQWGKHQINVIIVIAIQKDLQIDFNKVYGLLVKIFSSAKNSRLLQKADDYEQLLNTFEHME